MFQGVRHFRYMLEGRSCHIVTDHMPLTFAFKQRMEKAAPRQARQLDFVSQFTTDIRHIAGEANITADLLSRIETVTTKIDYARIAASQQNDKEIERILNAGESNISIKLKLYSIPNCETKLYCDTSTNNIRPYIPLECRKQVLAKTHDMSHPGVRATTKLMTNRFVWLGIRKDTANFVRGCENCQRSKVTRHTKTKPAKYEPPTQRSSHITIDIVGPFPLCEGKQYCLTMIDRFTR